MSAVLLVVGVAGVVLGLVVGNAGVVAASASAALTGVGRLAWPYVTRGGGR
jgi:hypothetical protein